MIWRLLAYPCTTCRADWTSPRPADPLPLLKKKGSTLTHPVKAKKKKKEKTAGVALCLAASASLVLFSPGCSASGCRAGRTSLHRAASFSPSGSVRRCGCHGDDVWGAGGHTAVALPGGRPHPHLRRQPWTSLSSSSVSPSS